MFEYFKTLYLSAKYASAYQRAAEGTRADRLREELIGIMHLRS